MRLAIPFALILALFCGCGGGTSAPATGVQGVAGERTASAQEESLLEDCIGPNIVDLDEIQDLLRDLFGEHELDYVRGDERPGDERPDLPSLDDLNLPEYALEGPDLDLIETRLRENVPLSEQASNVVFLSVEDLDAAAEDSSKLDPRLSDPNVQIITT